MFMWGLEIYRDGFFLFFNENTVLLYSQKGQDTAETQKNKTRI